MPGGSRSRDRGASPAGSKRKNPPASPRQRHAPGASNDQPRKPFRPRQAGGTGEGVFCLALCPHLRPQLLGHAGLDPYGLRYADAVADERPKPPRTASVSTPASGSGGAAVALSRPGRARRPRRSRVRRRQGRVSSRPAASLPRRPPRRRPPRSRRRLLYACRPRRPAYPPVLGRRPGPAGGTDVLGFGVG